MYNYYLCCAFVGKDYILQLKITKIQYSDTSANEWPC